MVAVAEHEAASGSATYLLLIDFKIINPIFTLLKICSSFLNFRGSL